MFKKSQGQFWHQSSHLQKYQNCFMYSILFKVFTLLLLSIDRFIKQYFPPSSPSRKKCRNCSHSRSFTFLNLETQKKQQKITNKPVLMLKQFLFKGHNLPLTILLKIIFSTGLDKNFLKLNSFNFYSMSLSNGNIKEE